MFNTFGRIGAPQKRPHRPENVGQQRNIFLPVMRHLEVNLVQHDIFWPSAFRKPYLKSGDLTAAELRTVAYTLSDHFFTVCPYLRRGPMHEISSLCTQQ